MRPTPRPLSLPVYMGSFLTVILCGCHSEQANEAVAIVLLIALAACVCIVLGIGLAHLAMWWRGKR